MFTKIKKGLTSLLLRMNAARKQSKVDSLREAKEGEMVYSEPIPDTPFHIIGNAEKGYFIAIGKYRLCETRKTIREALEVLDKEKWNVMTTLIASVITAEQDLQSKEIKKN